MNPPHKYWRVYDEALAGLQGKDLAERCEACGFSYDPDGTPIAFLDRRYTLSKRGSSLGLANASPSSPEEGVPTEEAVSLPAELQEEHLRDRILILHYLLKARGLPLSGAMIGFDQLSGARFYGNPFRGRVELPLVRAFAARPERLIEAALTLGGCTAEYGDCSVLLHPFPRVPLAFILWQGDDEVPANGKILWDATAEDYLSAEDLTVLGETVVRRFKAVDTDAQHAEGVRRAATGPATRRGAQDGGSLEPRRVQGMPPGAAAMHGRRGERGTASDPAIRHSQGRRGRASPWMDESEPLG